MTPKYITAMSNGAMTSGTRTIRANNARNIPLRSIFGSTSRSSRVVGASITSRDLTRDAPREIRISGIATAPAVSIARMKELWMKPCVLKNNSC